MTKTGSRTRTTGRPKAGSRGRARGVRTRRRPGPAILGAAGTVLVAAIIAVAATGGSDGEQTERTARLTVTGAALPTYEDGRDPALGLPAPALEGESFEGTPATIVDDARPKAIVFLAHWCPHCQREVPLIQGWLDERGRPEDVDLYSVATSNDPAQPNYPPDEWLRREGWTVPVLVDDSTGSAATAYGLTAFPYFVFVDAEGNVVARATGELTVEQLEALLARVAG